MPSRECKFLEHVDALHYSPRLPCFARASARDRARASCRPRRLAQSSFSSSSVVAQRSEVHVRLRRVARRTSSPRKARLSCSVASRYTVRARRAIFCAETPRLALPAAFRRGEKFAAKRLGVPHRRRADTEKSSRRSASACHTGGAQIPRGAEMLGIEVRDDERPRADTERFRGS